MASLSMSSLAGISPLFSAIKSSTIDKSLLADALLDKVARQHDEQGHNLAKDLPSFVTGMNSRASKTCWFGKRTISSRVRC